MAQIKPPEAASGKPYNSLLFECLFILVALIATYDYCKFRSLLTEHGGGWEFLASVAQNTGTKPWQYRILIPYLAKGIFHMNLPVLDSWDRIYNALEAGSVFAMLLSFRYFISLFTKDRAVGAILSFFIFLILPFNLFFPRPHHPFYWFDIPSVLFFSLGLAFMYQKKWPLYYAVFIAATLNRETSCFLTVVYLFVSLGREKTNRVALHCGTQFLIWMTIKAILFRIYANNPGSAFELHEPTTGIAHLTENLSFLLDVRNYPLFLSNMGFIWVPVLFYYRRIKNEFIQRALWIVFPYFAGMMFVANIYELRIFVELIPLFFAALVLLLKDRIKNGSVRKDGSYQA